MGGTMVKVVFFPPIAKNRDMAEHYIAVAGPMEVNAFIELLRAERSLAGSFANIRRYVSGAEFLREVIVIVNESVADSGCQVKDGDVVKFILPLAGG
jgi:molybdopterin converting factor small subunit